MPVRLNKEFLKRNFFNVILGTVLLVGLILFALASSPLIKKLQQERGRYRRIINEVMESELRIEKIQRLNKERLKRENQALVEKLPDRLNLPIVLDELAKVGRYYNIDFLSISPQIQEKSEKENFQMGMETQGFAKPYERLAVQINLKAGYIDLGNYLEALENLKHALVTVKQLNIERNEDDLSKLNVESEIELYNLKGPMMPSAEGESG